MTEEYIKTIKTIDEDGKEYDIDIYQYITLSDSMNNPTRRPSGYEYFDLHDGTVELHDGTVVNKLKNNNDDYDFELIRMVGFKRGIKLKIIN